MEINGAAQIRQAGGRRLLSKTEQTVGSKLMREGPDRAVRPGGGNSWTRICDQVATHMSPARASGEKPSCSKQTANEEGRRTKVTRIAMEKSTKLKQLKTAKILTYQNESSMEKFDGAWEAQKSGR